MTKWREKHTVLAILSDTIVGTSFARLLQTKDLSNKLGISKYVYTKTQQGRNYAPASTEKRINKCIAMRSHGFKVVLTILISMCFGVSLFCLLRIFFQLNSAIVHDNKCVCA